MIDFELGTKPECPQCSTELTVEVFVDDKGIIENIGFRCSLCKFFDTVKELKENSSCGKEKV